MKNKLLFKQTKLLFLLAFALFSSLGWGQTNPTAQTLPYTQNFGTTTFTSMPSGMASWSGLSGAAVTTSALAQASVPPSNATLSAATASQTGGGTYGYMTSSNARVYIQTSSNTSGGANQIALAINTTGKTSITVVYDIEIINASPRTVGIILQYRNGSSGLWTSVSGTGNPFSQFAGTTGVKANVSVVLPIAAENLALVQLRWATWRGTESGNSSGIAIDNISITSASTDATLSALALSSGTLDPTFAAATTAYTASVANATSTITVTPTRNQANATIEARVNGATYTAVTSGSASGDLSLNVGVNTVEVKVTAQDGTTTKTYTTTVTRAASTDATLSALALSEGTLDPTFAAATTTYAASVANATSTITVTPTRNQANATIEARVNGANGGTYTAVTSGSASGDLDLNVGDNTVDVKVTAQDGTTTKTYTTTVTRVSTDATLSALTISTGTLAPTFTALGNTYFASTSNATSTITVTATRNQANATIGVSVNGETFTALTSGSASGALNLIVGTNTIEVKVTAQDGITTETYSISVTRPGTTTWDGTSWSNGLPTEGLNTLEVIINGNFLTTDTGDTAGFTAERLTVNSGKLFTIATGHKVTVNNGITNNGTFTVKNNANLIQNNEVEANTGSIIVERESASILRYDYTLWSSPVAGQKLKDFSPDTLNTRFYTYNSSLGTNGLYSAVPLPATTNFAPATGYLIRMPNNHPTTTPTVWNGVFTGVPNNGTIEFTGLIPGKFYAVGNPYPSKISANIFLVNNFESISTLYFWRRTNGDTTTATAYATQNSFGETNSAGGLTPNGNIAVGQGFIIDVIPNATGTITFDNSNRNIFINDILPVFLRTSIEKHRLWLNLTNTSGLFSQMVVGYTANATMGLDNGIDGRYINDAPTALTSLINAEEFTIQGRPLPFTTTDTVPLGFKTSVAGNYSITIDHVDGLFSAGQTVYLKDNLLNTVVNLSAGSYSFASAIGTFNSRFEVVYQSTLSITNPTFTANSVIAFSENGEIKINSGSTIIELVRVYDLQGRLLVEKKQINASETKLSTTATNQVLLVEITATNGSKITKKIIQ